MAINYVFIYLFTTIQNARSSTGLSYNKLFYLTALYSHWPNKVTENARKIY